MPMIRMLLIFVLFPFAVLGEPPSKQCSRATDVPTQCIRSAHFAYDTCQAISEFARNHSLDEGFFARLIWQESRFNPNALSHANAMGIAQFIKSTAKIRNLQDPFNPAEALEVSARYLSELTRRFGSLGAAAIAYNGGETRVANFLANKSGLHSETTNYVQIITGISAQAWRDNPKLAPDLSLSKTKPFMPACLQLAKKRIFDRKPPVVTPRPSLKPWGVQLATSRSKKQAKIRFAKAVKRCKSVVGKRQPDYIFQAHRMKSKKGYYNIRLSTNSKKSARSLCLKMRQKGCSCIVRKN